MTSLSDLVDSWLREAERLRRRYKLEELARLSEVHAEELAQAIRLGEDELLPPDEAARASGYSKRRLRELEADGRLLNHGRKGAPLYRSGELPRRTRAEDAFDATAEASRILSGGRG